MVSTSIRVLAVLLIVACGVHHSSGAFCHGGPPPDGKPNTNPILQSNLKLIKQVKNAKLYSAGGNPGDADAIPVVHLWGTPYEMGYAHGVIVNETATALFNAVWNYLEVQVEQALNGTAHHLSPMFLKLVADMGLDLALEAELLATAEWTGDYFNEELRGMADATGVSLKRLQFIHMIGELTKGSCSMYGAWGKAVEQKGHLLQLRALDWDVDGPFKDYPEIIVYHPTEGGENGHAFANVAWSGFIGSITGISSKQMAISEIGVAFPDKTFGEESRFGVPFTYVLRDILQFDNSLADTEVHLRDAKRTCDLIFGVSDGKTGEFRSVQYSASVANFFTDEDMQPLNETWHPRMENIVYYGMDWICPTFNKAMHTQLTKNYGKITPEVTIHDILPVVKTGDLHAVVYDLTSMEMFVANARRGDVKTGAQMAYDRSFIHFNMTEVFAEKQ